MAYKRRLQDIGDYLQPRSGLRSQKDFDGDTFMQMTPAVGAKRLCRDRSGHAMLYRRRLTFFSLVLVSILLLVGWLTVILLPGGLTWLELVMTLLFAANLPWLVIGLCNAVIGFALLRSSRLGPVGALSIPRSAGQRPPSFGRIALVMPVHDEQLELVFRSLQATVASLDATGCSDPFDIFLLSDTRDQQLAAGELQRFRAWKRRDLRPERLHYRRRCGNRGFKAGNIRNFCTRWGHAHTCMIVLDADSMMTGAAILRLVGLMQANPRLGIVQTLVVGLPATSPFARIFQFGMRHGMRAYTTGSAWWQGDAGPYWGHNAIVRLAPFIEHCGLPRVPGRPPLGGPVLSHDQVEAVLMRRAGWEVRVLPIEDGSFEANPPTLLDFVKRDLRWCHGNMQYTRLLSLAGAPRLGRLQMLLAILMYTAAPCWLAFCLLSLLRLLLPSTGVVVAEPAGLRESPALAMAGLLLLFVVLAMSWAPKLFGLLHALTDAAERTRYGGGARLLLGAAIEVLFSALLTPVVGVAQTIFIARLLAGCRQTWQAQRRSDSQVSFGEAARELWPQALLGIAFASLLMALAPGALVWSAPMLVGLLLAIPFAVLTSSRRFGRWFVDNRLCATPEELCPEPEVRAVCPWTGQAPSGARARSAAAAAAVADTGS